MKEFENYDDDPSEYLRYCYIAFATHIDKPRSLWYAVKGHEYLDSQSVSVGTDSKALDALYRKGTGYHIVAVAYVWNDMFDEPFALEQHFLTHPYWLPFQEHIGTYLEMLMVKKQEKRLAKIFNDAQFKYAFLPWWETYMSLLVDDTTTITRMDMVVPIINRVNHATRIYGN